MWVFLFFAVIGSLVRVSRRDFDLTPMLAPLDFHGISPNFMVCAAGPILAFCSRDVIGISYYTKTALGAAAGLSLYELAQVFLPRRTFDPYDIVASFLGALFSILLAASLFLVHRRAER